MDIGWDSVMGELDLHGFGLELRLGFCLTWEIAAENDILRTGSGLLSQGSSRIRMRMFG